MNVAVDDSSIEVSSDALRVKSNWVGQNSITTLGTITTGLWTGTAIADAQVVNALTIAGGSVDSSVVGGSTPAAGTFTALTANDSLTVNADVAIIGDTTGNVTLGVKGVGSQSADLFLVEQSDGTDVFAITAAGQIDTGTWAATDIAVAHGGTGLSAVAKGSLLVANSVNTLTALDGGGSNDGVAFYTASSDTISWATSLDGGTF